MKLVSYKELLKLPINTLFSPLHKNDFIAEPSLYLKQAFVDGEKGKSFYCTLLAGPVLTIETYGYLKAYVEHEEECLANKAKNQMKKPGSIHMSNDEPFESHILFKYQHVKYFLVYELKEIENLILNLKNARDIASEQLHNESW
jgi:hypothetical protein